MKNLKENLIKNYQNFNLSDEIFEEAIKIAKVNQNDSYMDIIYAANKYIESYLIHECKDDIDLEILLLEKYKNAMFTIMNIYELDEKTAREIYESSFEYIIDNYDKNKSLYKNLAKIMVIKIKEKKFGIKYEINTNIQDSKIVENNDLVLEEAKEKEITKEKEELSSTNEEVEELNLCDNKKNIHNQEYIKKYINNKEVFSLIKEELNDELEYVVTQCLFGYYGKYNSVKSISDFFGISERRVFEIYAKVLKIYREMFFNWYDGEMILKLESDRS